MRATFPSVLSDCSEGAKIRFAGAEKIQKVKAGIFACLTNAQEYEVFFDPSWRRKTLDSPAKPGKALDRVFGIVIIPRTPLWLRKVNSLPRSLSNRAFNFDAAALKCSILDMRL